MASSGRCDPLMKSAVSSSDDTLLLAALTFYKSIIRTLCTVPIDEDIGFPCANSVERATTSSLDMVIG
jgi:hypothetical protein